MASFWGGDGMVILILSIVALVISKFIPVLGLILGIVTLILGIKGKKNGDKYATAVVAISSIAILYAGILVILEIIMGIGWNGVSNSINNAWSNQ